MSNVRENSSGSKRPINKILKVIGRLLMLVALAFVIKSIYDMQLDVKTVLGNKAIMLTILIGSLAIMGSIMLNSYAWARILEIFTDNKVKYSEAYDVYAKANIGKYLPGNVMHYVERNLFASRIGIKQRYVAVASVIEIVAIAFVAVVMGLLFAWKQIKLLITEFDVNPIIVILIAVIVIATLAMILWLLRSKIKAFLGDISWSKAYPKLAIALGIYALSFLIAGGIMVSLLSALGISMSFVTAAFTVSTYIIAWLIGFIVPGAPGGIGVREYLLIFLLASLSSREDILLAIVIHRLITIFGDVLAYLLALSLGLKRRDNL